MWSNFDRKLIFYEKYISSWHKETFPDATLQSQHRNFFNAAIEYKPSQDEFDKIADIFIELCIFKRFDLENRSYQTAHNIFLGIFNRSNITIEKLYFWIPIQFENKKKKTGIHAYITINVEYP